MKERSERKKSKKWKKEKKEKDRNDQNKCERKKEKQVPRGYIRCNYFIITHRIIAYDVIWWLFRCDYATLLRGHVRPSVCPSVGLSVRRSVGPVLFSNNEYGQFRGKKVIDWHHKQWFNKWRWSSRIWCTPAVLVALNNGNIRLSKITRDGQTRPLIMIVSEKSRKEMKWKKDRKKSRKWEQKSKPFFRRQWNIRWGGRIYGITLIS